MREGLDVVVALGGDGTVNEVVNGLLTDGPKPDLPALAVVPGGSTNVFARAIGLPDAPDRRHRPILEALRARPEPPDRAGLADDRYFTFNAGLGLDAEVVHAVEKRRRAGEQTAHACSCGPRSRSTSPGDRPAPGVTLERPGEDPVEDLHFVIVTNTAPWTYLGSRRSSPAGGVVRHRTGRLRADQPARRCSTLRHVRRFLQPAATVPAACCGRTTWASSPSGRPADRAAARRRLARRPGRSVPLGHPEVLSVVV